MTSSRRAAQLQTAAALVLLLLLAVTVVALQRYRDRHFRAAEATQQMLYVRSPALMTRVALSFDAIAADLYWIRAIQYYGGMRLSEDGAQRYDLLYPLLDLTTSLDPRFSIAYRFGAFFLSEQAPGGAGRPDLAIRLLEKAIAANPDRWEYPHDVGFVHYRYGRYEEAADWFRRAARVPGATNWLEPLAAVTLTVGGNLRASRMLWNEVVKSDQEWLRRTAEHRLQQLDAIEQIQQLQRLTAEYERRHGDPPVTWDALVADRLIGEVPKDPAGHVFVLNPWWGTVTVSNKSPMWPLPTERAP